MADIRPKAKTIAYTHLVAEIDYDKGTMTLTIEETGEAIVIRREWYLELQAIMADVGYQSPGIPQQRR